MNVFQAYQTSDIIIVMIYDVSWYKTSLLLSGGTDGS